MSGRDLRAIHTRQPRVQGVGFESLRQVRIEFVLLAKQYPELDPGIERVQLVWFVIGAIAAFMVINSGTLFL